MEEDVFVLIDKIPKPSVYKDEMSWKRFLSPLPRHKGYDEGWFLASDILLKLPLVIFCNVIYIPYRIRGLRELLDDPEKRFYPIVSLPTPITRYCTPGSTSSPSSTTVSSCVTWGCCL